MYTHQQQRQRLDARCQIYSRIKNKGFPPKLHKSDKKERDKEKKSRRIWDSWIPPVTFWKLDNHTIYTIVSNCQKPTILSCFEFPKSFHFENLPRNYLKKMWNFTQHNKFFHDEDKASKKPKSPFTRKIFAVYPNCLCAQPRQKHIRCGALGSKKSKMKEGYYQIKLIHSIFNDESVPKRS